MSKSVGDMTAQEFEAATRRKAWREQAPEDQAAVAEAKRRGWPVTPQSVADARALLGTGATSNTASTAPQPPAAPPATGHAAGRARVDAMTNGEFARAVKSRAWTR